MKKNERYALIFFLLVLAVALYTYYNRPVDEYVTVHEDPSFYVALLESNTVILRLNYPYTDARGPLAAALLAEQVFIYKRKVVVLQIVEENKCTRTVIYPVGGEEVVRTETNTFSVTSCDLEAMDYPSIFFEEGSYRIYMAPLRVVISGSPDKMVDLTRFFLRKIYPDLDKIEKEMQNVLRSVSNRARQ